MIDQQPKRIGARAASRRDLKQAEIDVLRLVCLGMTNREIAQRLATTIPMVKWRTSQVFGKLEVRNRVQAVARIGYGVPPTLFKASLAPPGPMPEPFKSAELQVLQLLAYGLTN